MNGNRWVGTIPQTLNPFSVLNVLAQDRFDSDVSPVAELNVFSLETNRFL